MTDQTLSKTDHLHCKLKKYTNVDLRCQEPASESFETVVFG